MKTLEARQLEARNRARVRRVRVMEIERGNAYSTISQTEPGVVYTISRTRRGWACECEGYRYTGCCKHIAQVERRSEREGWDFGTVARTEQDDAIVKQGVALLMGMSS